MAVACLAAALVGQPAWPGQLAPVSWTAYAARLSQEIQVRLALQTDPAVRRLHAYLDARAARTPQAPPPSVVVRVWLDAAGRITQVFAETLGDAAADEDLRAVLVGLATGAAPPEDMRQPVVLRLSLAIPA